MDALAPRLCVALMVSTTAAAGAPPDRLEASAPAEGEPSAIAAPDEGRWYGWQIIASDAACLAALGLSVAAEQPRLLGPVLFACTWTAPIVHFSHGNWGRGLGSFSMRIGGVGVGGVVGLTLAQLCRDLDSDCGVRTVVASAVVAELAVMALDATFARESLPPGEVGARWAPAFALRRDQATIGVAGRF